MNKLRRQELRTLSYKTQLLLMDSVDFTADESIFQIHDIADDLYKLLDEEIMCRDNIPENLQYSDRYEKSDAACENMEEAYDLLDNIELGDSTEFIFDSLKKAIIYINDACL